MGWLKRRIIEELEPTMAEWERRWIPIDESLPEPGQIVLVCRSEAQSKSFVFAVCAYDKHLPENEYGFRTDWMEDIEATHWMPLPAPPSDGK